MSVFILGAGLFPLSGGGGERGALTQASLGRESNCVLNSSDFETYEVRKYECTEDMFANCTCCY